jgi:hypothetical protein
VFLRQNGVGLSKNFADAMPKEHDEEILMGAFNIPAAQTDCPNCGKFAKFEVQFKYGNVWQYRYSLGQQLLWGGNDIGNPGCKKVLIEALGGPCPYCLKDDLDFDLLLESDRLVSLKPASKDRDYPHDDGFFILEN